MADMPISELNPVERVNPADMFVLQQDGAAKKLTGQVLINQLLQALDGHGGIRSIVKTGSSGLTDTYTITFADTSTSTFTVKNGEKGDKGDNAYVWVKYSSQNPTSNSQMYDTPDDWMGVYWGNASSAPTNYTQYKWFKIKGERGYTGTPASISSQEIRYQTSTSGSTIPSGTWLSQIPNVSPGQFLWTRTTIVFNTGSPVVFYSVARFGIDGSGSVASVNGVSPDSSGNVALTASDVGARPSSWTPTASDVGAIPASNGSVSSAYIATGAVSSDYIATIPISWSGSTAPYTNTVTVNGILSTDKPIIDLIPSTSFATAENEIEAWGMVYRATTAANSVTFYATEKPTVALNVQIKAVRK